MCTDDTTESSAIKRVASNFRSEKTDIDTVAFLEAEGLNKSTPLRYRRSARERLGFPSIEDNRMERYVCVLVLILSAPVTAAADCASRCLRCAQEPHADTTVDSLACTLECEGAVTSSWELNKCDRILTQRPAGLTSDDDALRAPDAEDSHESSLPSLVKRYGGFIKRIDKNKLFKSPWYDNAVLKGLFAKKFGEPLGKFGEREVPELAGDTEREDVASESETGVYDDAALNPVKRYGGFLRKFPKRSESSEESDRQELQKRYGGFMRRIRPKLRWDNQKRYGGFLRRHFKISVRSEEDPAYDDLGL